METCASCGGRVGESNGLMVCFKCGLVHGPVIASSESFYSPTVEDSHAPKTIPVIGIYRSAPQQMFTPKTPAMAEMSRSLKRAYRWSGSSVEKRLVDAWHMLKTYGGRLGLPQYVIEEANKIYTDARAKKIRYHRDVFLAASLYCACGVNGIPRSLGQICSAVKGMACQADRRRKSNFCKRVNKAARRLQLLFGLKPKLSEAPLRFTAKISESANLPSFVANESNEFIKKYWCKKKGITSHRPEILACAVVTLVAKKHGLQVSVSKTVKDFNISEVSVHKAIDKIKPIFEREYGPIDTVNKMDGQTGK